MSTISMTLDEETNKRFLWLRQHIQTAPRTTTRTIQLAFHLMQVCLETVEAGGSVWIRRKDGTEAQLEIM